MTLNSSAKMPLKRALGPLDQRRKVIRCEACAARKTRVRLLHPCMAGAVADMGEQCAGGFPCDACIRTGKTCRRQSSEFSKAVFVLYTETGGALIPAQVKANNETIYVDCFFAFLGRNYFVYPTEVLIEVLLPLVNKSTLLSAIVSAIGALDASRHGSCIPYTKAENPRALAYKSYASSIESLKSELLGSGVSQRDDVLWATFFLGLFELMVDSSGEGWAKHMLYGTSQLLQAAEPNQAISHARKAFLGVFEIFEANRAILYSEESILSRVDWSSAYQMNAHIPSLDSLGPISSIMVRISTFNNRFFNYIPKVTSFDIRDSVLDYLGFEAFRIQRDLFELYGQITDSGLTQRDLRQALLYYHATLLFLFNTFDYYGCWHLDYSPYLSMDEISYHVDQILHHAEFLLNSPGESGLLLIFPLRVTGTRVKTNDQRSTILTLLDRVLKHGFIAVNRIKDDLHLFWDWKERSAL